MKLPQVERPSNTPPGMGAVVEKFYLALKAIVAFLQPFAAPDIWHQVTFENNWKNFSTAYSLCAYSKDALGRVHLKGLTARGTAGFGSTVPVFHLPLAYRPKLRQNFAVIGNNKFTRLEITVDGAVAVVASDSATPETFVSLDGVNFDTRA